MDEHRLLHYEILERIGAGGMGTVYLAHDTRLDRKVAIKLVTAPVRDSESRARFLREARAASRLSHPNIVGIHAIESAGDRDFIVMEYVAGRALTAVIEDSLALETVISITTDLASALSAAHRAGIIHRDIKPGNIMVADDGRARVLDFGIASVDDAERLTRTDSTLGTIGYMSPEQARGEVVDGRSDLFSLGAVLYEMIAGRPPFHGEYVAATMFKVLNEDPELLASYRSDVPDELQRIVSKCLTKDAALRYQSADDLLADLRGLAHPDTRTHGAISTRSRTNVFSRRTRIGVMAGLIAVAVVGLLYILRPSTPSSIAIMPFVNGVGDPELAFLCEGIPESLINRLAALPDLKVISRASSFALRDLVDEPAEVARQLGVRTVLMGELESKGDQISIRAELVDARDNRQLWGQRYTRPATEIQRLEEDISNSIAEHLKLKLTDGTGGRLLARTTADPEAYRLYLRGRFGIVGSRQEMTSAVTLLRRATKIDPDFAPAWAGLAHALTIQGYLAVATRSELIDEARFALARALELDPNSSEVQNAAGLIRFYFDWDWEGAEAAFRRAIELNPGNASAYNRYSTLLLSQFRLNEALDAATKAVSLDPISTGPTHDLGIVHMIRREYEDAAAQFARAVEFNPTWPWGWVKGGIVSALAGDTTSALSKAAKAQQTVDGWGSAFLQSWLAWAYRYAERPDLARSTLDNMLEHSEHEYVDPSSMATAFAAVGDRDRTLAWVERAVEEKSPDAVFLLGLTPTFFSFVSHEPRYRSALDRMRYPAPAVQRMLARLDD